MSEEGIILAKGRMLRAQIRCRGMEAENIIRALKGESPAYGEDAFDKLLSEIDEDQLIALMNDEAD